MEHRQGPTGEVNRTKMVEDAIHNATMAGGNFSEGLKVEFRNILRSDKKKSRLSPEEITRMEQFVQGDSIEKFLTFLAEGDLGGLLKRLPAGKEFGGLAQLGIRTGARSLMDRGARRVGEIVRANTALGGPISPAPTGTLDLRALAPGLGNNEQVRQPVEIAVTGGVNSRPSSY